MRNFDRFVGIDWSGAKSPILTKSIAVASCGQGSAAPILHDERWSREKVAHWILDLLKTSRQTLQRTFIGIDANFGYAQEIGLQQFGEGYDYKNLWAAVEDASKDHLNFFAGSYWQNAPEYFWSDGKKPAHITLPQRLTEKQCSIDGYGHPESPFKLIGAKQVGKGGMAAMRVAAFLKREAGDKICIWPFEREIADSAQIVISEIYPRQFLMRCGHGTTKVRDLDTLNIALETLNSNKINDAYRFNDHDADAIISAAGLRMICGNQGAIPKNLSHPPMLDEAFARREGWIFGVGDRG